MEEWRLHRLIEKDDHTGEKYQIGGGIVRMRIGAVNGPLHAINVSPISVEDMNEEHWEDSFVRLQVADRVVWMEKEETQALIDLLVLAHNAANASLQKHNAAKA